MAPPSRAKGGAMAPVPPPPPAAASDTVFANDLSHHALDAHVIQYADDTQILVSGSKDSISVLISRMGELPHAG